MKFVRHRKVGVILITGCAGLAFAARAQAYVDLAPNLSKVIADARKVAVVEVVTFDREKHRVVLKEIRALKGEASSETVVHELVSADSPVVPRHILQWAQPGARGVLFVSGNTALVCYGQGWYQVQGLSARGWKLGMERPDLPLAYFGTVSRLAEGIELMLAGKDAIITTVPHGAEEAASFDLALNRTQLPGSVKVQRIRANMKMPAVVMAVSVNAAYLVGPGAVDIKDLPGLIEKLASPDAAIRAEAAADIGSLGVQGGAAVGALRPLLSDMQSQPRMAAAAALMRVAGPDEGAVGVLRLGLASESAQTRRAAASAAGVAGAAAAPLAPKLAELLKDTDEQVRLAALQAIAELGPKASPAAGAVKALLEDPELAIDAADALGRIGPAARPVPPALVKMLSVEQASVRWTAVRAMSQIGGEEAHPAVDFMIKALPGAAEVDNYNMHIYLALLGPVAKDAAPAIRSARLKNPVLPAATLWALDPDKEFPWQNTGRGFMPPGGGDGPDISKFIYEAYFHELGDRLRPAAQKLASAIMEGTEGDVPVWGYQLLNCSVEDSLAALAPHLADQAPRMRERAAVALGYMGATAAPARQQLEAAIASASSEREKRLIGWSLRQVSHE